jgi:hypothetical protein
LLSGQISKAYPDDPDDWYVVVLTQTASIKVQLTNYQANGQLLLYSRDLSQNLGRRFIAYDHSKSTMNIPGKSGPNRLPPNIYYIRVYSIGQTNKNVLYQLVVTITPG